MINKCSQKSPTNQHRGHPGTDRLHHFCSIVLHLPHRRVSGCARVKVNCKVVRKTCSAQCRIIWTRVILVENSVTIRVCFAIVANTVTVDISLCTVAKIWAIVNVIDNPISIKVSVTEVTCKM